MSFQGKTALITGGVSGIGFGIARAFAATGIDLVLTYRNEGYREQAAGWFEAQRHPAPRFVMLDVTDRERWRQVADSVGPVHILVNNAGVSVFGPTDAARSIVPVARRFPRSRFRRGACTSSGCAARPCVRRPKAARSGSMT